MTAQIERHAARLADRRLAARERLIALAFVVHLVGDLHNPMHAADRDDQGGNRLAVRYGVIPTNLHLSWDGYLMERGVSEPPGGAAGIRARLGRAERRAMRRGTVTDWARESWEVAHTAYGAVLADPCAERPANAPRPVITEEMTRRLIPVVRRQVARGGLRLARLLNEALASNSVWLRATERPSS